MSRPSTDELERKVAEADEESQIRAIAEAAVSESRNIRGPARFKTRHDVTLDGLPEVEEGATAPPDGVARASAGKSLEVLRRNLELAFAVTTDFLCESLELERRPEKEQVRDVAEAWGLVLEAYGDRMMRERPELAVAVGVTALTYGPLAAEVYFRRIRPSRAEEDAPTVASAAEVASSER